VIDFRIERAWSRDGYNIWVIDHSERGSFIWEPITISLREINDTERLPDPTLHIDGVKGRELIDAARKAFAGVEWFNREELNATARIEKAMQAHIDSLKLVVDRVVRP